MVKTVSQFDLKKYMRERAEEVNQALQAYLPERGTYLGHIGESMRYCVFPGGKRFRPILSLAAAEALGAPHQVAMAASCAFELIHCFSLAHDDLPCMDDDDERRGKPTCHKVYGEDGALLAGDGLALLAFEVACDLPEGVGAEAGLRVVRELAFASGLHGMVGGQVIDLDGQRQQVDKAGLQAIHAAKTGALIRGAVRCGAIMGGADQSQLAALTTYGEKVGLVFQITDDILDYGEDPDGASYPALLGLDESKRLAREAVDEALTSLTSFGEGATPLRTLATYLLERDL